MAWNEWVDLNDQSYMDIEFVRKAYENQVFLVGQIEAYLGIKVTLNIVNTDDGVLTQPIPAYLNLLEQNLSILIDAVALSQEYLPRRDWKGELLDVPKFNFSDVNRWFSTISKIDEPVSGIPVSYLYAGTFTAGNVRLVQTFRR